MVQLMPLHPKTSSSLASFKFRVFTSLVPAQPGCPGKEVIKLVNSSSDQGKTQQCKGIYHNMARSSNK